MTRSILWKYLPNNAVDYSEEDGQSRILMIKERLDTMRSYWGPIFDKARKEDQFIAGDQWDDRIRQERENAGRPVMTFNMLPSFIRRIVNDARENRPQLRVKPVQSDRTLTPDVKNQQGTKDYSLADTYMGIWRHIEHVSRADQAYDTALTHAVWHAFGYLMLNTVESPQDPFEQDLVIQRIKDPYTIMMDPSSQEADFSDMQDAVLFQRVSRDAFEKLYPEAARNPNSYAAISEAGENSLFGSWYDEKSVQVGTYWWVDHVEDEVVRTSDGRVYYMSDVEDILDDWEESGYYVERDHQNQQLRKRVLRPVAKWQRFTAIDFLTPEMETVFERIPIFPVLGDEILLDGRVEYASAIRDALDAQKSYNYHRTTAIEALSLQPKAPFVLTPEQIEGHEELWEVVNKQTLPFLLYNVDDRAPPPQRSPPPQPAFAELQQAQYDANDLQTIIGIHEAALGAESNERTGRAVLARQRQSAISTSQFSANLGRAIEACGRVAVQVIPKIYSNERVMRIRLPDDSEDLVVINESTIDKETGRRLITNDLSYGKYDVVIDTGPSYTTQREESIDSMLELLRVLPPEALMPVVHLIVKKMAFPGAEQVASVLRKMIPDQLKSEDERAADLPKGVRFDEQGNMVNEDGSPYQPPLTPAQQLQSQSNQIEQAKVQAELAKAQGVQAKAAAEVEKARSDLAEAQLEMQRLAAGDPEPDTRQMEVIDGRLSQAVDMLERHERSIDAHEDAIEARIADTLAEIVPAIRQLVQTSIEAANADDDSDDDDKSGEMFENVEKALRELAKRPKEIRLQTDRDGIVKALLPVYEKSSEAPMQEGGQS